MTLVSGNLRRMRSYNADIRGGFHGRGRQITVELSTTAIFGDLCGYFFGNVRDKTSNITWQYAIPCLPVIDCKMNEWLFHVKIRFRPARCASCYDDSAIWRMILSDTAIYP